MSRCSWCKYYTILVHKDFNGYAAFDEYGYDIGAPFCSINCAIAFINSDTQKALHIIEKRIDWIYRKYNINKVVIEAKNPSRLLINGGNLSYDEYREDFHCPKPEESVKSNNVNSTYYEDEDYNQSYDN
jgi:hypothetical protein